MRRLLRGAWPLATAVSICCAGENSAAKPAVDETTAAQRFVELALDFCGTVVATPGEDVPVIAARFPGMRIKGPEPIEKLGAWSAALQERLDAGPGTPVYSVITDASRVDYFHEAFALTDGSRCIAVAQGMPDAIAATIARVESGPGYQLMLDGPKSRVYGRSAQASSGSYIVVLPDAPLKRSVQQVYFERRKVRPQVSDADREKWANGVFDACVQAAQQRRVVTVADFGPYMFDKPGTKDGVTNISAPDQYPATVLFAESSPPACRIMLSAGETENQRVLALWRARASNAGAKPPRTTSEGESFSIPKLDSIADPAPVELVILKTSMPMLNAVVIRAAAGD